MRRALTRGVTLAVLVLSLVAAGWAGAPMSYASNDMTPTATPSGTSETMVTTFANDPVPQPDASEPNDGREQATLITVGQRIDKLSFWPVDDIDMYAVDIKENQIGQLLALDTYQQLGLDTKLRLFFQDGALVGENDDRAATDTSSHIEIVIAAPGRYIIEVTNQSQTRPEFKTYSLETSWKVAKASAAPAASSPAAPTTADKLEPNNTWETAREVPVGEIVKELNFVCPDASGCADNDFIKVALKGGVCYRVATSELANGLDTNVIVYGPNRDMDPPLAGNDDVAAGEFRSEARVCVPESYGATNGYILVGNAGNRLPPEPIATRTYALQVHVETPPSPSPSPVATPEPAQASAPSAPVKPAPVASESEPAKPVKPAPVAAAPAAPVKPAPAQPAPAQPAPAPSAVPSASPATSSSAPATSGVSTDMVSKINDAPKGDALVVVEKTNLHVAPGSRTEVITSLKIDEQVKLFGEAQGAWVRVQPYTAVVPGWVYAADLKPIEGTIRSKPKVQTGPVDITTPSGDGQVPSFGTPSTDGSTQPVGSATVEQLDPVAPEARQVPQAGMPVAVTVEVIAATTERKASSSAEAPPRPIAGVRVQLVNAFGDVIAEGVTAINGRITLSADLPPKTAVYIQIPATGVQTLVSQDRIASGNSVMTIALPQADVR